MCVNKLQGFQFTGNNKFIELPSIDGGSKLINNTVLNRVVINSVINKTYSFEDDGTLNLNWSSVKLSIGPAGCYSYKPNGFTHKQKFDGQRCSRQLLTCLDGKITYLNAPRVYLLVEALHNNKITLSQIDELVLNHKKNNRYEEGFLDNNVPFDADDYELISNSSNIKHGIAWNKAMCDWGLYLKLSYIEDYDVINLINRCTSISDFLLGLFVLNKINIIYKFDKLHHSDDDTVFPVRYTGLGLNEILRDAYNNKYDALGGE